MTALWAGAVTRHEDDLANLTSQESGELNRMLHVAMPSSETIRATDWVLWSNSLRQTGPTRICLNKWVLMWTIS